MTLQELQCIAKFVDAHPSTPIKVHIELPNGDIAICEIKGFRQYSDAVQLKVKTLD